MRATPRLTTWSLTLWALAVLLGWLAGGVMWAAADPAQAAHGRARGIAADPPLALRAVTPRVVEHERPLKPERSWDAAPPVGACDTPADQGRSWQPPEPGRSTAWRHSERRVRSPPGA